MFLNFFEFFLNLVLSFFSAAKGLNARAPWSPAPTPWSTPTPSAHASTPASSQTGAAPSWTAPAKCQWTTSSDATRPESVPAAAPAAAAWQTDEFPPSEPSTANNYQQAENGEAFFIFHQPLNKKFWHRDKESLFFYRMLLNTSLSRCSHATATYGNSP